MRRRNIAVFGFILVSGILIYQRYTRDSDVTTSNSEDTNQSLEEVEKHTAKSDSVKESNPQERKERTARLRHRMEDMIDRDDRTIVKPIEDEELARRTLMQQAVSTQYRKNVMAAFDQLVEDEPVDEEWTLDVQNAILNTIEQGGLEDTLLKNATCRRTVCRVRITHRDQSDREIFFEEIERVETLDGLSNGFHRINKDGTIDSTLYLGKSGQGEEMTLDVLERAYTIATGKPADSVVPTSSQIEQVAAARMR